MYDLTEKQIKNYTKSKNLAAWIRQPTKLVYSPTQTSFTESYMPFLYFILYFGGLCYRLAHVDANTVIKKNSVIH